MSNTYTDICPSQNEAKNTGFDDQCLETKLKIPILSDGFHFPTVADFKNKSVWRQAIADKRLVPLFEVYDLADASTADKPFEIGNFRKIVEKGVEKITFECFLSVCAFAALNSYVENGSFGEIFEFNDGDDYSGMFGTDGVSVKGRKIKSLTATRMRATKDKVPHVKCEIVYEDKDDVLKAVILKSNLSADDIEGIHDVKLTLVSVDQYSARVTVTSGCSYDKLIKSITMGDFVIADENDVPVLFSLIPTDASGVYELVFNNVISGNNFTINLDGVIVQADIMYESTGKLTFNV